MLAALLFGLVLLGSLLGSLWAWLRRRGRPVRPVLPPEPTLPQRPPIYVDGSNVMHWGEGVPQVRTLVVVLLDLKARGYDPLIWFDANVGYKLGGRYLRPDELAAMLPVPAGAIRIADKGEPADPLLIRSALGAGARVVSNDRFMDWRAAYPGIRAKGFLVKGRVSGDAVELTL